jgi:retron-type reverse transcriptase
VADQPLKKKHRRLALLDPRLLPPPRKGRWRIPFTSKKRMAPAEARHLFAGSRRTPNAQLRALLPDEAQLKRYGLPLWRTEADLAKALGMSVGELRFFSIHRQAERICHYITYTIPKANGGRRLIMAPKRRLKAIQRLLLAKLVKKLPVSDQAHGYIDERSVRSGAEPHLGRRILVQLDLKDFFPTITYGRVRGLFIALGYGYPVAAALAALMTEAERQPVEIDGVTYHVPVGRRHTVQGAPTSPGLSNCLLLRLDRRLAGLAKSLQFTYTRYADDLTFSSDDDARLQQLRHAACRIIREEGFEVNTKKSRTSRRGRRQRVTGVIVNDTLGLSRPERRKMRAAIHQLRLDVEQGKPIDPGRVRRLRGKLGYLAMLNAEQARALERHWPGGSG